MSSRSLGAIVAFAGYAALLLLLLGEAPGRVGVFLYLLSTCCLMALWIVLRRARASRGAHLARALLLANLVVIALLATMWRLSAPARTPEQALDVADPPRPEEGKERYKGRYAGSTD